MQLSIIIVNWHSKDFLRRCLTSVEANTSGIEREIIVIDSGSFDGCSQMLSDAFPHVRFFQSATNIGFARANNLAFKHSFGDHVLFLNPDTELVGPAINKMLAHLRTLPDAGAVGCRLENGDGSLQTTSIQAFPTILSQFVTSELLRKLFPRWSIWGMAPLHSDIDRPTKVDAISGACVMLKRTAFERIGMFSEQYFMYAEDLDLCHKVRQAGLFSYYVPDATVRHFGGGSSQQAPSDFSVVMMRQSIWRFLSTTRGRLYGHAYRVTTVIQALARLLLLVLLCPLQGLLRHGPPLTSSMRKWRAILGWSLGLRRVDARHDRSGWPFNP